MTRFLLLGAVGSLLGGCTLVYDTGGFVTEDAAPIDAAPMPTDADPTMLALTGVKPAQVFEGQGCLPDGAGGCAEGSRGIPVVVSGTNLIDGAEVSLSGGGLDGVEVSPVVSAFHDALAFTLQLPVDTGRDTSETVTVTVTQGDASDSTTFEVVYLPELTLTSADDPEPHYGELYSQIVFDDPDDQPIVLPPGDAPAQFWATAEIVLADPLRANGQTGGEGGAGGPGGCDGGAHAQAGGCGAGGGGAAAAAAQLLGNGGGGGAGGFGEAGGPAQGGQDAGDPGAETGDAMLSQIVYSGMQEGNRGSGGGGGSGSSGGHGGGGGGTVELSSGGALRVREQGAVEANGGAGQAGGSCTTISTKGGGGGGSGGAILVRAQLFDTTSTADPLFSARGGDPGAATNCNGGKGANGRIRIDGDGLAADPAAAQGPRIDPALSPIATEKSVLVTALGDSQKDYGLRLNDVYLGAVGGGRSMTISLKKGLNEVCAVVVDDENLKLKEALQCLNVAYIPQ